MNGKQLGKFLSVEDGCSTEDMVWFPSWEDANDQRMCLFHVCLCDCVCFSLFVCLSLCLSVYLCLWLSVCVSLCQDPVWHLWLTHCKVYPHSMSVSVCLGAEWVWRGVYSQRDWHEWSSAHISHHQQVHCGLSEHCRCVRRRQLPRGQPRWTVAALIINPGEQWRVDYYREVTSRCRL